LSNTSRDHSTTGGNITWGRQVTKQARAKHPARIASQKTPSQSREKQRHQQENLASSKQTLHGQQTSIERTTKKTKNTKHDLGNRQTQSKQPRSTNNYPTWIQSTSKQTAFVCPCIFVKRLRDDINQFNGFHNVELFQCNNYKSRQRDLT
jgi:hypothetical protein